MYSEPVQYFKLSTFINIVFILNIFLYKARLWLGKVRIVLMSIRIRDHGQTFYFDGDQISDSEMDTDPAPKEVIDFNCIHIT